MFKKTYCTLLSLLTVFKHLFMKPITLEYPEKRKPVGKNFRGKPSVEGCIKCGTCIKVCPAKAIVIENNLFKIDLKKCIFCGNCSFYCPVKAIKMTQDFELATSEIKNLTLEYNIEGGSNERNS